MSKINSSSSAKSHSPRPASKPQSSNNATSAKFGQGAPSALSNGNSAAAGAAKLEKAGRDPGDPIGGQHGQGSDEKTDKTDISQECKDDKCQRKDDKDGKKDKVDELMDLLKEMFGQQKAQEQQPGGGDQGGGGEQGGAQSPGGGGGGCNKAGGASPSGESSSDPKAQLEQALSAVKKAKSPQEKKVAQEKLKKLYESAKNLGTKLPEELERRIESALAGAGASQGGLGNQPSFPITRGVGGAMSSLLGAR